MTTRRWRRWQTSTFIAGLRVTGLTAPGVIDGAMDGDTFLAYVEQILVPTLQYGDIVIADTLAAHHVEGRAAADRSRRRDAAVLATVQSRSQPD